MALNSNFRTLTADNMEGVVSTRNYLKNSFENGSLTGWTELSVALTSGLPTGTPTISAAAASSLTLSVTSTTPLSLDKSLLVSVPSALTAGQGFISDAFTLDRMDLGKVITVSFDYELISGTYNFSGTLGSQTWMVYVYDVTAGGANWIQPAGFLGMNQSSSAGRVACTFQSSVVAGQQYRIAVIASQAAAGASSIEFDNFTASRQTAPIGPVVTDWQSYTPTGTWVSNATYTGKYRRVGDSIQCSVKIAITGAVTATDLQVSIPSGFSIDTAKMASSDFLQSTFGAAHGFRSSGGTHYNFQIGYASPTLLFFTYQSQLTSQVVSVANTTPFTWANGDAIHATFMVPVAGASSNVQLSNDTDTRVVAFSAYDGGSVAVTNTTSLLPMGTTDIDTHAVRSGQTYVIPVSGFYRLSAKSTSRFSAGNAAFNHALLVYKNGVQQNGGDYGNADGINTSALEFFFLSINSIFRLNAGDVIDFRYFTNYTGVATTYLKYCSIERLSGPSVIAASETVACRAYKSSGSHTTSGSEQTVASWNSKEYDTHNVFNLTTGEFIVPSTGKYHVSGSVTFGTNATGARVSYITVNGANKIISNIYLSFLDNAAMVMSGTLQLNAGDIVTMKAFQNSGGSLGYSTTVVDVPGRTQFNIVRVGI